MEYQSLQKSKGPIRKRKCTDIFCLIIFLSFVVFTAIISIHAYLNGDLKRVARVIDSDQKPCGEAEREDYPYIYINDPYSVKFYRNTICLKECPKTDDQTVECFPNEDIKSCSDVKVRASHSLVSRLCVPNSKSLANLVKKGMNLSYIQEGIEDLSETWPILIAGFFIGIVVLIIYICLMRYCTKCFVYLMIFSVLVGLILLGIFCWREHNNILNENADVARIKNDPSSSDTDVSEEESTEFGKEQAKRWKTWAIILWVVAGLFLIFILLLCSRISMAADVLASAAEFVQSEPSVFIIPFIFFILLLLIILWWIPTFAYLSSCGTNTPDPKSIFMNVKWSTTTRVYIGVMIFALLWYVSFNLSQETFSIAAMSASWYFERNDKSNISAFTGISWAFTYHIGTIAFGSFLIALLWAIQMILAYIYQKLKESGSDSTTLGFIVKCAACFVACFERLIKFINKHAYIETVLRNLNFCAAAGKCVSVIANNFLRFGILSGLANLFLFLGDLIISCSTTFITYFMIKGYAKAKNIEIDTIIPLLVVFLSTLSACLIFSYVYDVTADTLLHCLILDEEDGVIDGAIGGSGNCPEMLKQTVNKHIDPNVK